METKTLMLCLMGVISFVQLRFGYLRLSTSPNIEKKRIKTAGTAITVKAPRGVGLRAIIVQALQANAGMMLAVDAEGNFYPCTRFAQYSLRSKKAWIIGNVRDGIDKNKLRPFLCLDRCTQSTQECIDCEVAEGCAWCQGENYDAADTPTIYQRATAICKMHKARVRANNYYWNKLYRKLELENKED